MSSYGNHCWTAERDLIAQRLVLAAMDCDDVEFEHIIYQITSTGDFVALTALLAEQLAGELLEAFGEDHAACPIKARIAQLQAELEYIEGFPSLSAAKAAGKEPKTWTTND
jgi:hypothetical protein